MKASAKPQVKRSLLRKVLTSWQLYILLLPAILFFILFKYVPMYGIIIAFKKQTISGGIFNGEFVGLLYFKQLFQDKAFWNALKNTLVIGMMKLVFYFPIPIMIAIFINEISGGKFKKTVQTIIYLPRFISWTVLSGIVLNMLSVNGGVVNNIIQFFGGAPKNFLTNPAAFRWILVITTIIKDAGWSSIVYFAAITAINPELYEACKIDGGNRLQQIWHVTLSGIAPTITLLLILTVGNILVQDTNQVLTLYSPNVFSTGDILGTYVYRTGIEYGRFSFAAAAGVFNSVAALIFFFIANTVSKRVSDNSLF